MSRGLIVERWSLALLHSCSAYCFLGTERLVLRRYDKSVLFDKGASKTALTVYYAREYDRASSVIVIRADGTKEEIDCLGVPSPLWTHCMMFLIFGDEALCLLKVINVIPAIPVVRVSLPLHKVISFLPDIRVPSSRSISYYSLSWGARARVH